jgi:flavin reductase (DIM6/NTAB) family NADH-FMN oxidoreductase RutF
MNRFYAYQNPWGSCTTTFVGLKKVNSAQGSSTSMKELSLSKVYQLLEPGPVVLLTTARKGLANIMTMSWHMMVEFEPPLVACVISNANFSFAALRATKECVIAVPARKLAIKVVGIATALAGTWTSSRSLA